MKMNLKFPILLALLAMLILPASPVYAQGTGPEEGQVLFGSNYTLESGETFNGDLVVFGGNVTVEEGAMLNGNLVVFGGTITSNGTVDGDIVIMGGQVKLEESAVVDGDVVTIGSQVNEAEGSVVKGEVITNVAPEVDIPTGRIPPDVVDPTVTQPRVNINVGPFVNFMQTMIWILGVTGLSMLLMLFWQAPIERTSTTIVAQPLMTGAMGLVATIVATLTIVPLVIIPFAWLFGVVAMGREVGERLATAINQRWTPVLSTGVGTFLMMGVGTMISSIICVGPITLLVLGMLAVGGAVSTWFNLKPSLRPGVTVYTPPANSGEVPPTS